MVICPNPLNGEIKREFLYFLVLYVASTQELVKVEGGNINQLGIVWTNFVNFDHT